MSHKCLRCGNVYQDNDSSILRGCTSCGSIFFLYMRVPQDAQQIEEIQRELQAKDTTLEKELTKKIEEKKLEIEKEKKEIEVEVEEEIKEEIKAKKVKPKKRRKKFGIETVRIPKEGVYEIDIDALMKRRPLIILEKGRIYLIHLPSAFERAEEL